MKLHQERKINAPSLVSKLPLKRKQVYSSVLEISETLCYMRTATITFPLSLLTGKVQLLSLFLTSKIVPGSVLSVLLLLRHRNFTCREHWRETQGLSAHYRVQEYQWSSGVPEFLLNQPISWNSFFFFLVSPLTSHLGDIAADTVYSNFTQFRLWPGCRIWLPRFSDIISYLPKNHLKSRS